MSEPADTPRADAAACPGADPAVLGELEEVLRQRAVAPPEGSYSATLLADPERAQRKIMEEAFELCLELGREPVDADRTASEAADLVFHALVALVGAGVSWDAVLAELARRRGAPPRDAPAAAPTSTDAGQEPA